MFVYFVKMSRIKSIIILTSVYIVLVKGMSDELRDLLNSLHSQCKDDAGAKEESIAKAQKGDFEDDETLKCYMKCIFDETGLLDDDGKIDIDGMIGMLPDEIKEPFSPTVRKCGAKATGSNACELSFSLYKCCFEEAPQYYFLP